MSDLAQVVARVTTWPPPWTSPEPLAPGGGYGRFDATVGYDADGAHVIRVDRADPLILVSETLARVWWRHGYLPAYMTLRRAHRGRHQPASHLRPRPAPAGHTLLRGVVAGLKRGRAAREVTDAGQVTARRRRRS